MIFVVILYTWYLHYQEATRLSVLALWPIHSATVKMRKFIFPWIVTIDVHDPSSKLTFIVSIYAHG